MRIPLNLRSKLAIAFLLVLIPMLGLVIFDYLDDYRRFEDTQLESQAWMAQALATLLDTTLDQAVQVGQVLALDPTIRTLSSTDPGRLDPYLTRYLTAYPQFENINVWDAQGQNAGSSVPPPPGEPRPNIADRQHFQQAMATAQPAVSDVIVSRIGNIPTVAIAVPITPDGAGGPVGVVTILLDFTSLAQRLQTLQPEPTRDIWIANRTGRVAVHTLQKPLSWEERDISWYEPVQVALSGGEFVGHVERLLRDEPGLVNVRASPKYGWIVVVSIAESALRDALSEATMNRFTLYLSIVVLAALVAWGSAYFVIRPLRDLNHTIAAFGRGELTQRAHVRTGDELETTAETFNRMASDLQREQNRLRFLSEVSTALTSDLEVSRIARMLAERLTEVLGESSWVCLLPRDGARCGERSSYTRPRDLHERLLRLFESHDDWVTSNLFLPVYQRGEPILIQDVASSWMDEGLRRGLAQMGAVSLMVVPLVARGRSLGVLASLSLSKERQFGEGEEAFAMDIAGRAAMAIDNALLFQQVQGEQARLRTILNTVPVGVVVAQADGRVIMVNQMGEKVTGRPPTSAPPEQWGALFGLRRPSGEPYPPLENPLARSILRGETIVGEELLIRLPSGESRYTLVHSAPLIDEEGHRIGGVAVLQDITPLKEVQRRLEELARDHEQRRSELDAVIEGVSEGITIADGQGRIVRINGQGREIIGLPTAAEGPFSLEDYASRISLCYLDGRPMPLDQWPISRAIRGEAVSGQEVILVQPNGKRLHLLSSTGMVRDEQGRVRLAMSIFRDITPIRELERAREEFISVVAHDLRSPLTVITGFAGLLQRLPPGQHGKVQETRAVESILVSAKRLDKMVADLLDASRIEASRLVLTKETIDLPRLIHEVVERTAEITRGHPVRLETAGVIREILADPARLEQVLTNLLSNAAKYSYPGSEIVVKVEPHPKEREVMVSVANQGHGIAPEDREAIFARFRRARTEAEGRVPGLGLGLYITKGLVEAHGGRIWVESERGKTTTFSFTLPTNDHE